MNVTKKKKEEVQLLRESGKILVEAMNAAVKRAKEAPEEKVSTKELDEIAEKVIRSHGAEPAFLNYSDAGVDPFPGTFCVSLNDEIVHGIPKKNVFLKEGDLLSLDLGVNHKGFFTDAAVTIGIGELSDRAQKILDVTKKSLNAGLKQLKHGAALGDYGHAVDSCAKKHGFVTVKGLVGHGVGYAVHEPPQIPNYGKPGVGFRIEEGMVLALEPMLSESDDRISLGDDGFAFVTYDGGLSAHFEHTVVIGKNGCEILTDGMIV